MARKALEKETYRTLFSKTGNQCAFPDCTHPLIDDDNKFIAQICHIEAAAPKGERYNPNMTDELRRSPSNLLVLCYRHHIKTNDVVKFPVNVLKKIKAEHEKNFAERPYHIPDTAIAEIVEKEKEFWSRLE